MKKLKGYNFKLKKGDLILLKRQSNGKGITYEEEELCKKYVGVVGNYDGVNSKSGVLLKGYQTFNLSNDIREINSTLVFCWYHGAFRILKEFDGNEYHLSELSHLRKVDLFKLGEDETKNFKSLIIKTKITKNL